MYNLADEKYLTALIVRVATDFSIPQILEGLKSDRKLDAAYTVVGELLEKGLIRVSGEFRIAPDNSFTRVYEVNQERRDELEQYVKELEKRRVQPDSQGIPRGLNYRIAEGMIHDVIAHAEKLENDEKESLLTSIYHYLGLAQEDEMTARSEKVDPVQSAIIEAHLRNLYAEYLWLRREWVDAITQLLITHSLFNENGLVEKGRNAELRICEMLGIEYESIKEYKQTSTDDIVLLVDFEQKLNKILNKTISDQYQASVFLFLANDILDKIKQNSAAMQVSASASHITKSLEMDTGIMRLFTDNPITSVNDDSFGFTPYVQLVKDSILSTEPLPFCVGIFGESGSGKSSFMYMLRDLLYKQTDDKIKTIWFNPWKYDEKEDLWNALIQTILNSILEAQSFDPEERQRAKELALATTWLALKKTITAVTAGVIAAGDLDSVVEAISNKNEKYYRHINQFDEDFAYLVNRYTNGGKLVIFIDDLDRCLPENAITVLESLKLFIGNGRCIFVLGMDHSIVEAGIESRYGKGAPINGREYLDKIVQVPFFLPPVSYAKLKASLQVDENSKALTDDIWNVIHLGMGANPRKTRRFVNSFYLLQRFLNYPDQVLQRRIQEGSNPVLSPEAENMFLAKTLVFQMSFPDFYQHLQRYPDDWEYLDKYIIQEDDAEKRKQALIDKEELEPFWKNTELRTFMRKTSGRSYKGAPRGEVVLVLLQATNFIRATDPVTRT